MSSAELERGEGNPVYAALLVDVKNSKEYDNGRRMALQERIDDAIRLLNDLCEESLVKKVGFSGGDEIQGLFHDPVSAYLYYRLFSLTLGVGTFRCGIGVGAWDVRLEGREESAAQDGEAYHLAREAIGEAARSKTERKASTSNCETDIPYGAEAVCKTVAKAQSVRLRHPSRSTKSCSTLKEHIGIVSGNRSGKSRKTGRLGHTNDASESIEGSDPFTAREPAMTVCRLEVSYSPRKGDHVRSNRTTQTSVTFAPEP